MTRRRRLASVHTDHRQRASDPNGAHLRAVAEMYGTMLLLAAGGLRDAQAHGDAVSTFHTSTIRSSVEMLQSALQRFLDAEAEAMEVAK